MITREFNLYLHAGHSIPLVINVNQYDRGEQWLFTLFNADGTQYTPSSGAIVGIKSDNLGIINSGTVDSQGRVVINETQQMTAAVGKAVFELLIDDQTHGTANFIVLVEPKPGDNADLSESDISMIEEAVEAAANIKPYGSPLVASTVAGMTDHDKVYVYVGSETGYTSGHWYYYDGDSWEDGGVYNSVAVQTDTTLAISGMAADSKKVGDELNDLKSQISEFSGIPYEVKQAMANMFDHSAYLNYDASEDLAIFRTWASSARAVSITATFTQGSYEVYPTDPLASLKRLLVVTVDYDNGTHIPVADYTLSGTLEVGTSEITVSYGGFTDTFEVTVTTNTSGLLYEWDFTYSLEDLRHGQVATLACRSESTLPVQDSNGVTFNAFGQALKLGEVYGVNRAIEIDVASFTFGGVTTENMRLLMFGATDTYSPGSGVVMKMKTSPYGWCVYGSNNNWSSNYFISGKSTANIEIISGKTVRFEFDSNGYAKMLIDGVQSGGASTVPISASNTYAVIGNGATVAGGGQFYNAVITGCRVYDLSA